MKLLIIIITLTELALGVFSETQIEQSSVQADKSKSTPSDDKNHQASDPILLRSIDDKKEYPKETQMAQCTVQSTDGLKVQAQATFSKKLDGICSTDDMKALKENLKAMEARLYRDIYNLQLLIERFLPQSENSYDRNYPSAHTSYQYPPYRNVYQSDRSRISEENYYSTRDRNSVNSDFANDEKTLNNFVETTLAPITTTTTAKSPEKIPKVINSSKLKSLDTSMNRRDQVTTSSTTQRSTIKPRNEYSFYWKLDNFPNLFQNARKNEIFSHIFNVKGLFIRIRAMLNLKEDETFLLDMEHLAENTEKVEVEMSDGLIFKEIAEERLFQYSFVILDQNNPNNIHVSPTYWNNENENYIIPNVQLLKAFLKDNSLLIKLIITF